MQKARKDKRAGKSTTTQAGEFVHEEIRKVRRGQQGGKNQGSQRPVRGGQEGGPDQGAPPALARGCFSLLVRRPGVPQSAGNLKSPFAFPYQE